DFSASTLSYSIAPSIPGPSVRVQLLNVSSTFKHHKWARQAPPASYFASESVCRAGQAIRQHGTARHQATFIHAVSNSIHCLWVTGADGSSRVLPLVCVACDCDLDLFHLANCPSGETKLRRQQLQQRLVSVLERQ